MDMAQDAPETVLLAEDEASLYLQATTMRVWAPIGQTPTVRIHTGRENTNFYGCLNLRTGTEISMQAETMNSTTTANYLQIAYSGPCRSQIPDDADQRFRSMTIMNSGARRSSGAVGTASR
jgi:hypothetical protein